MQYLTFDLSEGDDGVTTIEALAATSAQRHAAVMAEVDQLMAWAQRRFPHTHGPLDEGHDWDHDLPGSDEGGGWTAVTLTLTGSEAFVAEFMAAFGEFLE